MIKGSVSFFATVPSALVHALNFFVSPAGSLVLLSPRNWNKGINLKEIIVNVMYIPLDAK
jgi:hypothetical protein